MKILIALLALGISSLTMACTDFSGTFENQDTKEIHQIVQADCTLLQFIENEETTDVKVDGNYHQTLNQDVLVNGQKHGVLQVSKSARFGESELFVDTKLHTEVDGTTEDSEKNAIMILNADGNLMTKQSFPNGQIETITNKRIQ